MYGIPRGRPTITRHARALALTFLAGIPAFTGFMLVAARASSTSLWLAATAMRGASTTVGTSISDIYGPLTGVIALPLWASASAVVLFYGIACCAQLEACRNGDDAAGDPGNARN